MITKFIPLINYFKTHDNCELELLLGTSKESKGIKKFSNGIDKEFFFLLLENFNENKQWTDKFSMKLKSSHFNTIRVRTEQCIPKPEYVKIIKKTTIGCVDLCSPQVDYCLRLKLSIELDIDCKIINSNFILFENHKIKRNWIKKQKRACFIHKDKWEYSFSNIIEGKSTDSLYPVFGVELELLQTDFCRESSSEFIAEHFKHKINSFFGKQSSLIKFNVFNDFIIKK
jgi:hypothetical protein